MEAALGVEKAGMTQAGADSTGVGRWKQFKTLEAVQGDPALVRPPCFYSLQYVDAVDSREAVTFGRPTASCRDR